MEKEKRKLVEHLYAMPEFGFGDGADYDHYLTGGTALAVFQALTLDELKVIHKFDHDSGNLMFRARLRK